MSEVRIKKPEYVIIDLAPSNFFFLLIRTKKETKSLGLYLDNCDDITKKRLIEFYEDVKKEN